MSNSGGSGSGLARSMWAMVLIVASLLAMILVTAAISGGADRADRIQSYGAAIFLLSWVSGLLAAYQIDEFKGRSLPVGPLLIAHLAILLAGFLVSLVGANVYSAIAEFERLAFQQAPTSGPQGFTAFVLLAATAWADAAATASVRKAVLRRLTPR